MKIKKRLPRQKQTITIKRSFLDYFEKEWKKQKFGDKELPGFLLMAKKPGSKIIDFGIIVPTNGGCEHTPRVSSSELAKAYLELIQAKMIPECYGIIDTLQSGYFDDRTHWNFDAGAADGIFFFFSTRRAFRVEREKEQDSMLDSDFETGSSIATPMKVKLV